jgi:iron complex transport system permease protein
MMTCENREELPGPDTLSELYSRYTRRKHLFIISLVLLILLLAGIAATVGTAGISVADVYASLLGKVFPAGIEGNPVADLCLWKLRLPRICMAVCAGIALGSVGAVMQSIMKNPLADPYMMGIQSAAGFGASVAIICGSGIIGGYYLVVGNAFLFSLVAVGVIVLLSEMRGATAETMILNGIAVMFFFTAMTTFIQYFAEAETVKSAMFWAVGDLGRITRGDFIIVVPLVICCFVVLFLRASDLNILSAGDETAKSLGIQVRKVRLILMIISSLLVSGVVCFTGAIGFVGLVSPHITRMIIGGDNRFVLPAAGMVGAVLLIISDTIARTVLSPAVVPVGVITAFLGVPFFVYLIMVRKGEFW